jgi:DNA-binding PadR family transcriptional regulator
VKVVDAGEPGGAAIPMTGSIGGELAVLRARKAGGRPGRGGRGKKVYGITDRGALLFEELLAAETQSSEDDRVFNLRLAFARHLPPDARLGMLERRRAQLLERLVQLRARVKASRERVDGYARSLMDHDRESAEHDLSWIDRLIATERAGGPGGAAHAVGSAGTTQVTQLEPESPADYRGPASPSLKGLRPLAYQEDRTT